MIVLHEGAGDAERVEGRHRIDLGKPATGVAVALWSDQLNRGRHGSPITRLSHADNSSIFSQGASLFVRGTVSARAGGACEDDIHRYGPTFHGYSRLSIASVKFPSALRGIAATAEAFDHALLIGIDRFPSIGLDAQIRPFAAVIQALMWTSSSCLAAF